MALASFVKWQRVAAISRQRRRSSQSWSVAQSWSDAALFRSQSTRLPIIRVDHCGNTLPTSASLWSRRNATTRTARRRCGIWNAWPTPVAGFISKTSTATASRSGNRVRSGPGHRQEHGTVFIRHWSVSSIGVLKVTGSQSIRLSECRRPTRRQTAVDNAGL